MRSLTFSQTQAQPRRMAATNLVVKTMEKPPLGGFSFSLSVAHAVVNY